jgi:hypothetical protein
MRVRMKAATKAQNARKFGALLILFSAALSLSGCSLLRTTGGPCFGFGCRAASPPAQSAQSAPAKSQNHQAKAFARNHSSAQTAQTKAGN